MRRVPGATCIGLLALLGTALPLRAEALGTGFGYQGRLAWNGTPVTSTCTFQFSLWDSLMAGIQCGSTITIHDVVPDSSGLFSITVPGDSHPHSIDFGAGCLDGNARYLEVWVQSPGYNGGANTQLSPRQRLNPTPYALQTRGLFTDSSLNVGIGTPTPGTLLHLKAGTDPTLKIQSDGTNEVSGRVSLRQSNDTGFDMYFDGTSASESLVLESFVSGASQGRHLSIVNPSGNVGIGTGTPQNKLHIQGDGLFAEDYGSPSNIIGRRANGTSALPTPLLSSDVITRFGGGGYGTSAFFDNAASITIGAAENWTDTAQGSRIRFLTTTNTTAAPTEKMRLDHDGVMRFYNTTGDETVAIDAADPANAAFITLRMLDGATLRDTVSIEAEEAGGGGQIILRNQAGSQRVQIDGDGSADEGFIVLYNGAGTESISLDGEDGTGNGRVKTQILEITGGSDLSEQFDVSSSDAKPEAGMVVCIDPANPGKLAVCSKPYDRTVAGVVSGAGGVRPGMLMGQRGSAADGEHPVALTGRVYVLADASNGPIQPGDLLTTSTTAGHAMKASDHAQAQGAILGKAMTSLSAGTGLVLVLVSLQ